jgi:hypothetical protein
MNQTIIYYSQDVLITSSINFSSKKIKTRSRRFVGFEAGCRINKGPRLTWNKYSLSISIYTKPNGIILGSSHACENGQGALGRQRASTAQAIAILYATKTNVVYLNAPFNDNALPEFKALLFAGDYRGIEWNKVKLVREIA